jgi:molybdopterin converting factor subunit 1
VRVRVLYFGIVRERLGMRQETVEIADGACVSQMLDELAMLHPAFAAGVRSVRVARNEEYVDSTDTLFDNDEVAIIPPVSGGVYVPDR